MNTAFPLFILIGFFTAPALAYDVVRLDVNGMDRVARIYPGANAHRRPSPLVFVFHGRGDNERNFSNIVRFHKAWPEATVVYPRGTIVAAESNQRGWQSGQQLPNRDLEFFDQLLELVQERVQVQLDRVYVTGFSNGARFTFLLLAERPRVFAAFAPVGGLTGRSNSWVHPRPVIYLFGRDEPRKYRRIWAETVVALTQLNRASGEIREWAPQFTAYPPKPKGALTVTHLYHAGHVWPLAGNSQIVRFFRQFDSQQNQPGNKRPDGDG